jgi:hypothetical protein
VVPAEIEESVGNPGNDTTSLPRGGINTGYIMIKDENIEKAIKVLRKNKYEVRNEE